MEEGGDGWRRGIEDAAVKCVVWSTCTAVSGFLFAEFVPHCAAIRAGLQPVLPSGLCGGGTHPLHTQPRLLHAGGARLRHPRSEQKVSEEAEAGTTFRQTQKNKVRFKTRIEIYPMTCFLCFWSF